MIWYSFKLLQGKVLVRKRKPENTYTPYQLNYPTNKYTHTLCICASVTPFPQSGGIHYWDFFVKNHFWPKWPMSEHSGQQIVWGCLRMSCDKNPLSWTIIITEPTKNIYKITKPPHCMNYDMKSYHTICVIYTSLENNYICFKSIKLCMYFSHEEWRCSYVHVFVSICNVVGLDR